MPRIGDNRPRQSGPRLITTTPSSMSAPNMLAPIGEAIEKIAAEREREAEEQRVRADRVALARAESEFILRVGRGMDAAANGYDGAEAGFAEAQAQSYDEALAGALEAAPERIRPALEARLAGAQRARHLLAAGDIERTRTGQYALQGFLDHVDQTANVVTGDPAWFPDALASIDAAVEGLPEDLQARARAEAIGQVSRSYAEARLNSDATGFLRELEAGGLDDIFPAEVLRSYTSQAQTEIERQERAARIEAGQRAAAEARVLARMLDDAEDAAEQGFAPEVSFSALSARAQALGGEEGVDLARRAEEAAQIAALTEELRLMPPAELEARLASERARLRDGASGFDARRVASAERTLAHMRTALNEDPVAYARRTGVGDLPELDLSSLEAFGSSLAARAPRAGAVADHYGVERKIFTRAERLALGEAMARGDLDRFSAARTIVSSLGGDAPAALAELAPDEPLLADIGGLMTAGAETAARDLAAGARLRQADGFNSRLPSSRLVQSVSDDVMGGLAERLPETALGLQDAAEAIYEARAQRAGLQLVTDSVWPRQGERLFQRALHEAAGAVYVGDRRYGGLVEHRGSSVIAPNWLAEDRFDDAMRAIAGGDLGPRALMTDGRGRALSMDVLERSTLRSIGDQRYLVEVGRDGGVALDDAGAPFVLDLSAYRVSLARAYPDWVR